MKLAFYLFTILLQVGKASLSRIQYRIPSSIYGQIVPVSDANNTLIANHRFCLGFSGFSQHNLVFGIFMNWQEARQAELIWSPRPNLHLDLSSSLFLNSTGSLVLQNNKRQVVWSAGANVKAWNLTDTGNLVLYDQNGAVVWQSWDDYTDTVVAGQPFDHLVDKIYTGPNSFYVSYGGCWIERSSSSYSTNYTWAQLSPIGVSLYIVFINSTLQPLLLGSYGEAVDLSNSFLRVDKFGGFSIHTFSDGLWSFRHIDDKEIGTTLYCKKGWPPKLVIAFEVLLLASLLVMLLYSVFLFLTKLKFYLKLIFLIISTPLTSSISIALLLAKSDAEYPFIVFSGALDVVMLQIINITLLCLCHTSGHSRKTIIALIVFNLLALLSSMLGIIMLWDYRYRFLVVMGYQFGYFLAPSFLSIANTICLIVIRLPGRKWCKPMVRLAFVLAANSVATFLTLILAFGLGDGYNTWTAISPLQIKMHDDVFWISLLIFNVIFISVFFWSCYSHRLTIRQSILTLVRQIVSDAKCSMQSVQSWSSIQKKKMIVWLVSRLLRRHPEADIDDEIPMSLSSFTYEELEVVTDGFTKLIGRGGFGGVYKGTLLDGKKVAVKKLESTSQGKREFKAEIEILGKVHHVNLAGLLGFCVEGPHRLLIYELIPNGSLDKWIFDDGPFLDWPTRMKILVGTARGLAYLHEECDPRIIHLDVKPQNILLDECFAAKVSDFGLCRFLPRDETSLVMTRMMGTLGYLAPECVQGTAAEKNDVYSFGIVALEVVSGIRSYKALGVDQRFNSFRAWALVKMHENSLMDPRLQGCFDEVQTKMVIEVALLCTESDPNMRPTMGGVLKKLENGNAESYISIALDNEEQAIDQFAG